MDSSPLESVVFGLKLLIRALRNDILDACGHEIAGRSWFVLTRRDINAVAIVGVHLVCLAARTF